MSDRFRIGIISGKLGDVDGVSLEVDKWIGLLGEMGHEVHTIAGKYGTPLTSLPEERQFTMPGIRFDSEEQRWYERQVFPHLQKHPPHITPKRKNYILDRLKFEGKEIASRLFEYVQNNDLDVIVAQNTNAMPMTLLGGMGVYELAGQRRVATIFHHHDFWWERSRFSNSHIEGLLGRIMPPTEPGLEHIVLSSYAAHILQSIKRVQPKLVPNCEDFDNPVWKDEYNRSFRKDLGFREDDILFVQPTRIVRRKRIEDSVTLIGRFVRMYPQFADRTHFIISLYQGDEPDENYIQQISSLGEELGIPVHLISERVASARGVDAEGRKLYTNRDVLANADIVTYLPIWEGFGNALLEAIAAKVPVVTTTYLVYKTDIGIMKFRNVEIRDVYDEQGLLVIPDEAVQGIYELITNKVARQEAVELNFEIASREFGFPTLRSRLGHILFDYGDEIRASRKRIAKSKQAYSV
jgi:mannosylglucosylglycerate synthase